MRRIFRYLKVTLYYWLWYKKYDYFTLKAYTNVYWARCADDRRSTSGGAYFLGDMLVSWLNKKQYLVSLSMPKVEYIATTSIAPIS